MNTETGFAGAATPNASGGFLYLRNRWYDPKTGRFLTQDPIGLAGGVNLYSYAENNPINFSDAFGLLRCPPVCGPPQGALAGMAMSGLVNAARQALGAISDFVRNYGNMREANTIGADKYFHCNANCEATKRGPAGERTATVLSDVREAIDQSIKGDPPEASNCRPSGQSTGSGGR